MSEVMNKVVGISLGLTVLFILLNSIVMTNYQSVGGLNIAGTGLSASTFQGILLLVFVLAIVGVAMAFFRESS